MVVPGGGLHEVPAHGRAAGIELLVEDGVIRPGSMMNTSVLVALWPTARAVAAPWNALNEAGCRHAVGAKLLVIDLLVGADDEDFRAFAPTVTVSVAALAVALP